MCISSWWLHSPLWPHISIRWRFNGLIVNFSSFSKQHREVTGGRRWGERGERDGPPGVTELGNVGVPSVCFVCLFVLKIVCRFKSQIHWLTWLRWSGGPPCSEEPTWPPFFFSAWVREASLPTSPPPTSSNVVCSEAPGCLPAGPAFLPGGGLSGYLGLGGWSHAQSGLWDMWREPGVRGAWDPVICWLESS